MSANLISIAARIKTEHESAYAKAGEALAHARECGNLLLEAKQSVEHGEWSGWVAANCSFSLRTAQGYMRLASKWGELPKNATVALLPLREALASIAVSRRPVHDVLPDPLEPEGEMPEDAAAFHTFTLDQDSELSTILGNDMLAVISPSFKHPGHFYVEKINVRTAEAYGMRSPCNADALPVFLKSFGLGECLWVKRGSRGEGPRFLGPEFA